MSDDWVLSIDFGTTASSAAVDRGGEPTLVQFRDSTRLPSGVFLADDATMLVGRTALNAAGADPGRYVRAPKRMVGVDSHARIAGADVEVARLVAAVLAEAAAEATRRAGGNPPGRTVLSHPARWAGSALATLVRAAELAGLGAPDLVAEPVAAGHGTIGLPEGDGPVAVYDLGGGTFDAAVLVPAGESWSLAGRPGGIDSVGGEAVDAALHRYLIERLGSSAPDTSRALDRPADLVERRHARTWWNDLRDAKEVLSDVSSTQVAVPGTAEALVLTRDELELVAAPLVARTVDELARTVAEAGVPIDQLGSVLLCGDASRMPIVARLVQERFDGTTVRYADDPKGVVAKGAARAVAATRLGTAPAPEPDPAPDHGLFDADADVDVEAGPAEGRTWWQPDPVQHDPVQPDPPVLQWSEYRPALRLHWGGLVRQLTATVGSPLMWEPSVDSARVLAEGPAGERFIAQFLPSRYSDGGHPDGPDLDSVEAVTRRLVQVPIRSSRAATAFGSASAVLDIDTDAGLPGRIVMCFAEEGVVKLTFEGRHCIAHSDGYLAAVRDAEIPAQGEELMFPSAPLGPDGWLRVPPGFVIEEHLSVDMTIAGQPAMGFTAATRSHLSSDPVELEHAAFHQVRRELPGAELVHVGPIDVPGAVAARGSLWSTSSLTLMCAYFVAGPRPVVVTFVVPGRTKKSWVGSPRSFGPLASTTYYLSVEP